MNSELRAAGTRQLALELALSLLVNEKIFERIALIVVTRDQKRASVWSSRGYEKKTLLELQNSCSALAVCLSRIYSVGHPTRTSSPLGSSSFALSPVFSGESYSLSLYADFGSHEIFPFDARRTFRAVVALLASILQDLEGPYPLPLK